jgi:hypothetical protein
VAKFIHAIEGPNTTRAWWKGEKLTTPAALGTATRHLALEALLGKVIAVLLERRPEVGAPHQVVQLLSTHVHVLQVNFL